MSIQIAGIGWVNAGGFGRGRDGKAFEPKPGNLPKITRKDVFPEIYQRFGRLDGFSKIGLAAIAYAVQDAEMDHWDEKRPVALVAETDYGCMRTDIEYFDTVVPDNGQFASPNLFAYTLPNCFLGEAAIRYGFTGPSYVLNSSAVDDLAGLREGLNLISWGEADTVVAGFCNPEVSGHSIEEGRVSGACFLVLKEGEGKYGSLEQSDDIQFNGQAVGSTAELVKLALGQ